MALMVSWGMAATYPAVIMTTDTVPCPIFFFFNFYHLNPDDSVEVYGLLTDDYMYSNCNIALM